MEVMVENVEVIREWGDRFQDCISRFKLKGGGYKAW